MHRTKSTVIGAALLVAWVANGCVYDRIDADRRCDDNLPARTPPGDEDSASDTGDAGVDTSSDSGDTGTDFSCHLADCQTNADCGCTPHSTCPQTGPSFIKHHCLILDCDINDPATCPEGVSCIDATELSFGEISWVCSPM